MPVRDLSQWFGEHLEYPLPSRTHPKGRTYRVPSPDGKTGAWLTAQAELGAQAAVAQAAMIRAMDEGQAADPKVLADLTAAQDAVAALKLDDDAEKNLYERVLGPAYQEMLDDGVDWMLIARAGEDAYLYFAMSQEAADRALRNAAAGKAEPATTPEPVSTATTTGISSPAPAATRVTPPRKAGSRSSRASTPSQARTRPNARSTRGTGPSSSTPAPTATTAAAQAG